jgi:hypothetical protein
VSWLATLYGLDNLNITSIVFYDATSYNLAEIRRLLWENSSSAVGLYLLPVPCWIFFLAYISSLSMESVGSSETQVNGYRLHGIASQKITLFIVTSMRTSNPTTSVSLNVATA